MSKTVKKRILVVGATGSIGDSTMDVLRSYDSKFELVGVVAGSNATKLGRIVNEFGVECAAIAQVDKLKELKDTVVNNCNLFAGQDGVVELIRSCKADVCVSAIVGSDGLLPTITAVEEGMDIALANKESLVAAGDLLIKLAKEYDVNIIPVDSEHSGILQCLEAGRYNEIDKVIITASGGAFRDYSKSELQNATPEKALVHPTWSMGKKITIDCATLANKGLEVIEAHWMFGVDYDNIEVLIHRESVIHAMVEYCDGSIITQMAMPNMSLPILYALAYPERLKYPVKRVDFAEIGSLTFKKPDTQLFPMLDIAYAVGRAGGLAPAVYSAANEEAVRLFLNCEMAFMQISKCTEYVLGKINTNIPVTLENILRSEDEAHSYARDFSKK